MERIERIYKYQQLLRDRGVVPRQLFMAKFEVSLATFKRDLEYMRDRMDMPVEWDAEQRGYKFAQPKGTKKRTELPGLWFTSSEAYALLTMEHLLKGLEPGLLSRHVQPLLDKLHHLLASDDVPVEEIQKRIRILRIASRTADPAFFEVAATAVLKRRQLKLKHWSRMSNQTTERVISPQRLVLYRGNWYVDAWCHLREDIRSFALDGVKAATILEEKAKNVAEKDLEEALSSGYGIFTGRKTEWATLRFSPEAARWVAYEKWHSKQKSRFEDDGSFVLEIPYSDDRELVMDVLRHGPNIEVIAPPALRAKVGAAHTAAAKRYR